jgi:cellulose 1,4-beta-cellobiosidase
MVRRTRFATAVVAAAVAVTGMACTTPGGPGGTTTTTGPTQTTTGPTTPTTPTTAGPTTTRPVTTTTTGPTGPKGNPFPGAKVYVNADWSAKATASGGSKIANQPTAVWLDRIAAINGTASAKGLRAHLDAALAQGAGLIQFVIYDLPGRDCAALASNGELGPTDLPRYQSEYIDPIAAIQGEAKYRGLRIVNVIEPDSLPNLVTNVGGTAGATPQCDAMKSNGNYVKGVQYALGKLGALGNVFNYIDIGHHGWLGWDTNFNPTVQLMTSTIKGAPGGVDTVAGFIANTANYSPTVEPYLSINDQVNGQSVRQSKFVDWNFYVDEQSFAVALGNSLSGSLGKQVGMLIDTSRNGWGGAARPTAKSTSTDLNTFVDQSRTDRRIHKGNWCNQSGAGIGERPRANPATGIHAYVWVKPPGESDGSSSLIPNDEGKGFDRMCDPTYTGNGRNGNSMTGSLANAPVAGQWFDAQFRQLLANAYPAL